MKNRTELVSAIRRAEIAEMAWDEEISDMPQIRHLCEELCANRLASRVLREGWK